MTDFTEQEKAYTLMQIEKGADILDYRMALILQQIQKDNPDYITIGKPMGSYSEEERMPYFGAIATDKGKKWYRSVLRYI